MYSLLHENLWIAYSLHPLLFRALPLKRRSTSRWAHIFFPSICSSIYNAGEITLLLFSFIGTTFVLWFHLSMVYYHITKLRQHQLQRAKGHNRETNSIPTSSVLQTHGSPCVRRTAYTGFCTPHYRSLYILCKTNQTECIESLISGLEN